jgi:hypothetical protein
MLVSGYGGKRLRGETPYFNRADHNLELVFNSVYNQPD